MGCAVGMGMSDANEHHFCFGSGMFGCLYDNGPNYSTTKQEAIEALLDLFEDSIEPRELRIMGRNLELQGYHGFSEPSEAGAQYCEIIEQAGPCPEAEG